MYGSRSSPSYSPPRRTRSPSYSPPRSRRFSPVAGGVSPPRGGPAPLIESQHFKRNRSRSRSRSPLIKSESSQSAGSYQSWYEEETLRTLHCRDCDVVLYDRESMRGHLKGYQHLKQQTRIRDREVRVATGGRGLGDMLWPEKERLYDDRFWNRERGGKGLKPEQERFLDTTRMDKVKAKFDANKYDYGQYKFREEEMHCEVCDVWTKDRNTMEAHKAGANHLRKSSKIQRFQCTLCLIVVPCQDTLDNHMRGKDHIKREKQLQEQRKERGDVFDEQDQGYKTGPREMAKLDNNEREELVQLRQRVKILQEKVKQYQVEKARCVREHGTQEIRDLREKVRICQDQHTRPQEFARRGLFCKKEELDGGYEASTSGFDVKEERSEFKRE